MRLSKTVIFIILSLPLFSFGGSVFAEDEAVLLQDKQETLKAKVLEIISQTEGLIPGTETKTTYQKIRAEILEGDKKGIVVDIDNDFLTLEKGQVFYATHTIQAESGKEYYVVGDVYRLPWLLFFIGLFIFVVCVFGGVQGFRGLVSLGGSLLVIVYILLPGILAGYSPILLTIVSAGFIIVLGSYITHGFNRTTSAAVIGMLISVIVTGLLAWFAVHVTKLSGFESEEAVYLHFNTKGTIDFSGLLFGGIIIGLLGVLYDASIGQAVAVEELFRSGGSSKSHVYKRAIRIGREHIGALVDTLAIAYVGASLPLLLLFFSGKNISLAIANREVFAAELIRTMIGSIGLVLAVPITTAISVFMLERFKNMPHKSEHHHSHTHFH